MESQHQPAGPTLCVRACVSVLVGLLDSAHRPRFVHLDTQTPACAHTFLYLGYLSPGGERPS